MSGYATSHSKNKYGIYIQQNSVYPPRKDLSLFLCCLALLVVAYFSYGKYLEKIAKIDSKAEVPSKRLYDGVDYVPMPRWRTFLVQLLNIAGTGPIFGAILGACYGPVAFLWITLGGIFMGAMHDFLSGVILVRNDGLSISEIASRYLGKVYPIFGIALVAMTIGLLGVVGAILAILGVVLALAITLYMFYAMLRSRKSEMLNR